MIDAIVIAIWSMTVVHFKSSFMCVCVNLIFFFFSIKKNSFWQIPTTNNKRE